MASSTSFVLSEACIIILFSYALHLELIMYVVKRKKLKLEPKQPAEANKKNLVPLPPSIKQNMRLQSNLTVADLFFSFPFKDLVWKKKNKLALHDVCARLYKTHKRSRPQSVQFIDAARHCCHSHKCNLVLRSGTSSIHALLPPIRFPETTAVSGFSV